MKEKTFRIYKTTAVGPTYFMRNEDYRNQGKTMTDDMQREAFEQWIASRNWFVPRFGRSGDEYIDTLINSRWEGWQAAIRYMREQEDRA